MKNRLRKLLAIGLSLGLSLSVVACGANTAATADAEAQVDITSENGATGEADASAENAALAGLDYHDTSLDVETRVEVLLSQMTLEEKVGQLIQAEQVHITPEEVAEYYIGSVLSGGGSAPSTGNTVTDWNNRLTELKEGARDTRLGIPLLYGIDAVHGNNNISGATVFPHNISLGAAADEDLMYRIGAVTASEVRASGAQWTFAPCIGNPQDIRWGRTYEGFSERTEDIGPLAASYIKGFQENGIIACAKHYIGEGYTVDGINQGNVQMTDEEFDALLAGGVIDPYDASVKAGVYTVMASYNSVNGVKCHENYHLLTEVLKDQLGFTGLVVGDYNAVSQVSGSSFGDQIANCVNAGVDLLMEPDNWKNAYKELLKDVEDGKISMERLDDAVRRNLRVKFAMGLFEEELGTDAVKADIDAFGGPEHREVAREAVRKSLILLKNETLGDETAVEAIAKADKITVAGQKAFDVGSQCGGWTISWQGMAGNKMVVGATPIIQGFAEVLGDSAKLSHSVDGTLIDGCNGVVVVVGETPYAETDGDRREIPAINGNDEEMLTALRETIKSTGRDIPVVAIVVAGRPMDISEFEDMFDAVIMAGLPGSEGAGIADVLFGEYDFTGTTKYTWPDMYEYGTGYNKKGDKLQ